MTSWESSESFSGAAPSATRPDRFYGRHGQVEQFFRMLREPQLQPLQVLGLPCSGRTSFLCYLAYRGAVDPSSWGSFPPTIVAYVDLDDVHESPAFYLAVARAIAHAAPARLEWKGEAEGEQRATGSDVYSLYEAGMEQLLEAMGQDHPRYLPALTFQQRLAENIHVSRQYGDMGNLRTERSEIIARLNELALSVLGESFNKLCGLAPSKKKPARTASKPTVPAAIPSFHAFYNWLQPLLSDYRVVVLLDEFDALIESPSFRPQFYRELRSLVSEYFVWVTVSRRQLHVLLASAGVQDEISTSPFYNVFHSQPIYLGALESNGAAELIHDLAASNGVSLRPEETAAIQHLAGGLPYFLQVVTSSWLATKRSGLLPEQCGERVLTALLDPHSMVRSRLDEWWRQQFAENERTCLGQAAAGNLDHQAHAAVAEELLRFGLMSQAGDRLQVAGELLKRWIVAHL